MQRLATVAQVSTFAALRDIIYHTNHWKVVENVSCFNDDSVISALQFDSYMHFASYSYSTTFADNSKYCTSRIGYNVMQVCCLNLGYSTC